MLLALVICGAAAFSVFPGTLRGSFAPGRLASQRRLTFAQRVAYQRAIEEVYWRHRIWPNERRDPKPSLDVVMSQAQIENKVADYLRDSQALGDYWQNPITAEQLQAEMERMARDTRQPDVLRELFDAFGNDPFVIAECLARPVLTERLVAELSAGDKAHRFATLRAQAVGRKLSITTSGTATYTLPEIDPCTDDTWTATTTVSAPDGRFAHTTVWTGSEMIVWGGSNASGALNSGGRYNPSIDSWTATSSTNAPMARLQHTAVWTGSEMIVWGGGNGSGGFFNTGGRYNPSTDSWTATSSTNAPMARLQHTAVWTGTEMIVWGGGGASRYNTGGKYDPSTDTWTATSITNAPSARESHTAVWTGNEMIVWGGCCNFLNTGGKYDPSTDSWTVTSTTNAPDGRYYHTAVWTGNEMIVWSGRISSGDVNTGGRYDPSSDSWMATSTTNAPEARESYSNTAVWTDTEMIVWGGQGISRVLNTGGRYIPGSDSWMATSTTNAPDARYDHTMVWTDSEMLVWGGQGPASLYMNTGGKYCAQSGASPTPTASATATATSTATPTATSTATATPTATSTTTATPRITPTPRSRPTAASRPTPPPHLTPPPPPSPRPTPYPRPTPPPHVTPVPTPSSPRPTPAPRP